MHEESNSVNLLNCNLRRSKVTTTFENTWRKTDVYSANRFTYVLKRCFRTYDRWIKIVPKSSTLGTLRTTDLV